MPAWFEQLDWSPATPIDALNADRASIPAAPGLYAFIEGKRHLIPGQVLYVGKSLNLRQRLPKYLRNNIFSPPKRKAAAPAPVSRKAAEHMGRLFIFDARARRGDKFVFVKWCLLPSTPHTSRMDEELKLYEANLINFLNPDVNSRDEEQYYPLF